jgi:membrane-associated phospholipid phosphatase
VFARTAIYRLYAEAILYTLLLGITLSTILKAFTGRTSPPHHHHGEALILIDTSRGFDFGFMNHHVIGGWPSSHTTIALALAVVLILLLSVRWYVRLSILVLAVAIGIGVTFGFHWLSEFVAGACLGVVIGLVVGRYYRLQLRQVIHRE